MGQRRIGTVLVWLGGGQDESATASERAGYQLGGVLLALAGVLTWLVATAAVAASTSVAPAVLLPFTVVFGVIVAAVARALATGPRTSRAQAVVGRATVAVFLGVLVGELAAVSLFSGAVDRSLDAAADRRAAATPAVVQADRTLNQLKTNRTHLDDAVNDARGYVDRMLVIARCEANPGSTLCPREKVTGVPGDGPETMTANQRLAAAQAALDTTVGARDRTAPGLDADIRKADGLLADARTRARADVDRSLGARWSAMHDYTAGHAGAMLSRAATDLFFVLLVALPWILRQWRGETQQDRSERARARRHRAESEADTAIAVKQAQVRADTETLWAEQHLEREKMAAAARTAIERDELRRRVGAAVAAQADAPAALSAPERP
ncbi:MAG: DUF4407 domain-containing protein, partial [Mycobacteriaceae bacterium]|nr:DUF4407 domain-containing protein [Mycobacteriaceae bacterium]